MATAHSKSAARIKTETTVFVLLTWMSIPLCMTLYFWSAEYKPMRGLFSYAYEILTQAPLFSNTILLWQWLAFTPLILLAGIQSLSSIQLETRMAEHLVSDIHIHPFDGQGARIV